MIRMAAKKNDGAGEPRRAPEAPQSEHRRTANIAPEAEAIDEARIDRRSGNAGDRGEEDRVDLVELEPAPRDGARDRLRTELGAYANEGVIRLPKILEVRVLLEREGKTPFFDSDGGMQLLYERVNSRIVRPALLERPDEVRLRISILWKDDVDMADAWRARISSKPAMTAPGSELVHLPFGLRKPHTASILRRFPGGP